MSQFKKLHHLLTQNESSWKGSPRPTLLKPDLFIGHVRKKTDLDERPRKS
jgi:hypothetical protein